MNTIIQLLLNPAIVSLFVGVIVGAFTQFMMPNLIVEIISMYLVFTIGFKGGACLGIAGQCTPPLIMLAVVGAAVGLVQPFIHYFILKKTTAIDRTTAGVLAAEYGSISIVTFITAVTFLEKNAISYDMFMPAIAGIMEIPAIFSGLWLIKHKEMKNEGGNFFKLIGIITQSILGCIKINIIFIGFFVGILLRHSHGSFIHTSITWPFTLALIIFMLNIGIKIAQQRDSIHKFSASLIAFSFYMPIINGCLGVLIARNFASLPGTQLLFALLLASASYIAVPAIMRTHAKNAQEIIYLPMVLGLTLPFNIIVGIPFFLYIVEALG